jgi:hypothetical protein
MEYQIYVGTILKLKKGFLQGKFRIMYCGMSSDDTFVISPIITSGYQGYTPTIYYKANSTSIQILDRSFDVLEVTPEYIVLGD